MDPYNVLFLCTGNSARSIMAERLLEYWGRGRFHAFSAGSQPQGSVHPLAIETLARNLLPVGELRSKSWEQFAAEGAPRLDFVFTVCDRAAQEACPVWPGQPMTAHWGIEDPAAANGSDEDKRRAFNRVFRELDARIKIFTSLRLEALDEIALQRQLDAIGKNAPLSPFLNPMPPCRRGTTIALSKTLVRTLASGWVPALQCLVQARHEDSALTLPAVTLFTS
jgi:arsenate reductase